MKKGQVVLFVVIILTVMLIVITSVVNRTLISVKNTTINTDSSRAFNGAEAGIEELLNRTDLGSLAEAGPTPIDIEAVNPSNFSERKYTAQYSNVGYFETKNPVVKDDSFMIEFNAATPPSGLAVYFKQRACVLLSAINTSGSLNRYFFCVPGEGNFSNYTNASTSCSASPGSSAYNACTVGTTINFPAGTPYALLIKVLNADSQIRVTAASAANYDASFKTKNVTGNSWVVTNGGVKKQIEVQAKTTKDIYPVFDYALYLR